MVVIELCTLTGIRFSVLYFAMATTVPRSMTIAISAVPTAV